MKKAEFRAQIDHTLHLLLDKAALVLDMLKPEPAPAGPLAPGDAAVFRWTNDQFRFWTMCANRSCKRARGCRGEPQLCLDRQVPQKARDRVHRQLADAMRLSSPSPRLRGDWILPDASSRA